MRQSDRRKILWSLVLLFIVVGAGVIFYAQGYRVNFNPLTVQKIGAIYVKSFPGNANVYLNGKPVQGSTHIFGISSLFLQGGTLINDLLPKKYVLTLIAPGYRDWSKTMEVMPSLVSEAKYAVMVPGNSNLAATTSVSGFWLAGNNILKMTPSGLSFSGQNFPGSKVLDEKSDGRVLVSDKNGNLSETNLNSGATTSVSLFLRSNALSLKQFSKVTLDNGQNNLLLQGDKIIYSMNLSSGILQTVLRTSAPEDIFTGVAASPSLVAASEYNALINTSIISVYDKNTRSTSTYAIPLVGRTVDMDWKNGHLGLTQSDGSFFFGDPRSTNGLMNLASNTLGFAFSNDLDLAAVWERSGLEIIPLAGNSYDYAKLLPPNAQQITNIQWYSDGHHLFLNYPDKTLFLDTGDSKLEHLYEVGSAGAQYMPGTNELYFLQGGFLNKIIFPS